MAANPHLSRTDHVPDPVRNTPPALSRLAPKASVCPLRGLGLQEFKVFVWGALLGSCPGLGRRACRALVQKYPSCRCPGAAQQRGSAQGTPSPGIPELSMSNSSTTLQGRRQGLGLGDVSCRCPWLPATAGRVEVAVGRSGLSTPRAHWRFSGPPWQRCSPFMSGRAHWEEAGSAGTTVAWPLRLRTGSCLQKTEPGDSQAQRRPREPARACASHPGRGG